MIRLINWSLIFIIILSFSGCKKNSNDLHQSPYAIMQEIPWTDVEWTEGFWAEKVELCREEIIPAVYRGFRHPDNSEQIGNLEVAAGLREGKFKGRDFSDGDTYKWLEALAFMYAITRDSSLDSTLDYWIDVMEKVQLPNGYLSSNMQLKNIPPYTPSTSRLQDGGYHEIYNIGHLLSAACTHYKSTGKDNFLNIAIKLADHMCEVLVPEGPARAVMVGNLPVIMGLVDMYRITGNNNYLDAAHFGIDIRGTFERKADYTQDHVLFRNEDQAAGHAVFATYLYSGAADIYAETGEKDLFEALERIWKNSALKRSYITGAVGAIPKGYSARGDEVHEAYGADYQLPSRSAYNETCANVGNAMWNWRMLLLTGDAKYADVMETVLFNSMLSAVSLDGREFFYCNPLEWDFNREGYTRGHTATRWPISFCYCCPPQIARTIAGIGRWAYTTSEDRIWIHLYGGNELNSRFPDGSAFELIQKSDYPLDGRVRITLGETQKKKFTMMLRIPQWAENAQIKINGSVTKEIMTPGSYAGINRKWKKGDVIELDLPMEIKLMEARSEVEDCRDKVTVMRGPVVYCAEFPVNDNGKAKWEAGCYLPGNVKISETEGEGIYQGLILLNALGLNTSEKDKYINTVLPEPVLLDTTGWENLLYRGYKVINTPYTTEASVNLTLIPYHAWANKGPAYMRVWIPLAR
jgi:uncharacterized protein